MIIIEILASAQAMLPFLLQSLVKTLKSKPMSNSKLLSRNFLEENLRPSRSSLSRLVSSTDRRLVSRFSAPPCWWCSARSASTCRCRAGPGSASGSRSAPCSTRPASRTRSRLVHPRGHREVTERSPSGHRQVTVRSPTGHRQVTDRSP